MQPSAWIVNRLYEGSTWIGGAVTAFGHISIQLQDPTHQQLLQAVQTIAQYIGPAMVAMSTKHP